MEPQPTWLRRPTVAEMDAAYPPTAKARGIDGYTVLRCRVDENGRMTACAVVTETPPDLAFGAAALKLAPDFGLPTTTLDRRPTAGTSVTIPVRWIAPRPLPSHPTTQTDHFALGPGQFAFDTSGSGAVLCAWSIYLETQAATKACALPRTPTDDAIDRAVSDIDDFIIANSSLHPSRAALDDFKRRTSEAFIDQLHRRDFESFCGGSDLAMFRSGSPIRVASSVRTLLAKRREPLMNPCL
jgi:TonB family protein